MNPVHSYTINFLKSLPVLLPAYLEKSMDKAKEVAEALYEHKSLFVLGKGFSEAIAKEISLKIKEVTYIHAEGYNTQTFKHGPLAMIDSEKRTPVIIIVDKNDNFETAKTVFEIVKNKNATLILITNAEEKLETKGVDFVFNIPDHGIMSSFYAIFFGQFLAYYIALKKGFNPDKPRNLSKEVTV